MFPFLLYSILISSFISLYFLNTIFTETNLSIKALEIKISIVFNCFFANDTTLSYFILFFFIIGLYLSYTISSVFEQIFNPTAELAIHTGTLNNESNAEIET